MERCFRNFPRNLLRNLPRNSLRISRAFLAGRKALPTNFTRFFPSERFQISNRIPKQISSKFSQTHFCRLGSPNIDFSQSLALQAESASSKPTTEVVQPRLTLGSNGAVQLRLWVWSSLTELGCMLEVVVLCERTCFCLLSAFYKKLPSKNPSKNPGLY